MEKIPFDEKIETERLVLKRYELTFETAIMLYDTIKQNWDFLTRFLPRMRIAMAPEDEYAWISKMNEKWRNMDGPCYSIWTKDGNFIGACDLHSMDYETQSADIGYWLAEKYTGKGYMTEAIKAVEDNFFKRGFNRFTIVMDVENKASEKVAVRCGYIKEGTMRQWHYNPAFNSYRDMYLYSKLKSEWEKEK
ncbi:MAG: GNAT family N-acetyltransferase [Alphaproteobacteria bacterium]